MPQRLTKTECKCACLVCRSTISDPICTSCQISEIEMRLHDFAISKSQKSSMIGKLKRKLETYSESNISCILCKKENVTVCMYCVTMSLSCIASTAKVSEDVSESFLDGATERGIATQMGQYYKEDEE